MNFNNFFQSKIFKIVLWTIGGLILLLLTFKLGISVGYRKASFSYGWGENYHRNFGGPAEGFFKDFFYDKKDFIDSHGTFGQIIKIDPSINSGQISSTSPGQTATLIIKSRDNVEKIILAKNDTAITRFREKIKLSELKIDDYIVAIGQPNDIGQIEAKLIRIMPPPKTQPNGNKSFLPNKPATSTTATSTIY